MSSKEREEFILKERIRMRELCTSKKSTLPDSIGESSISLPGMPHRYCFMHGLNLEGKLQAENQNPT